MTAPGSFEDHVGAFTPEGRFVVAGAASGPLAGLTFAAKDLFDIAGHPTGAGNPVWRETHATPTRHAALVEALLGAGATLVGKTITDELAYSLHGDNIHYGAPRNAAAPDRVTGGSSSGSVAAVTAGYVDFALGTDTGGSTRVPASYCGVWGLRPTHGLLSSEGLTPLNPRFDTPTWFAREASTFQRVADVLAPASDYAPKRVLRFDDACAQADAFFAPAVAKVSAALERMLATKTEGVQASGADGLEAWRGAYMTAGGFEGWLVHGEWINANEPRFAPEIAGRWRGASAVTAEAAAAADMKGQTARARVRGLLSAEGVAVLPSAASLAPRRDASAADVDAIRMRTMAITCIGGLSGLPQVSIPMGLHEGAPFGVSLMGPPGSDRALIALAIEVQRAIQRGIQRDLA